MSWILALVLACASPEPVAGAPDPAPLAAPTTPATLWSAANIGSLVPSPPSREGRTPTPLTPDPAWDEVLATLGPVVDIYAGDPQNPWAVAHGLLARGGEFKLTDGRRAIDALFADWAERQDVGGLSLIRFPKARGDVRVEPHTSLLLKALTEAGADPNQVVTVAGQPATLADHYRATVLSSWLDPTRDHSSFASPDDIPWAVQGLAAWAPTQGLQWTASDGTSMDLRALVSFNVAILVKETAFISDAMATGASFERKGQGIFRYTCGGAHVLQGASYAVARGFGGQAERATMASQAQLAMYRFPRELAIYDDALARMPQHRLRLLVQRMKFVGHFLESMHKMAAMGLFTPDDAGKAELRKAADELAAVVKTLKADGVFDTLPALRAQDEQLYLDVVGDASHAVRGLQLALGTGTIRY